MPVSALEWSVPLTFLLCGCGFLLVERMGFATARWGYALLLLGAGFGLMLIQTHKFSAIKPLGEDMLLMAGIVLLCRIFLQRFGFPANLPFKVSVMAITLGMSALSLALLHTPRLETYFVQLGCVTVIARSLFLAKNSITRLSDKILFSTLAILLLALAIQCFGNFFSPDYGEKVGAWRASFWGKSLQFTGIFGGIGFTFSIMLAESLDFIDVHRAHAHVDALTGLLNRRGFEALFSPSGRKQAAMERGAILLADIDHFKRVNDTFGHQMGDAVIAGFGTILNDCVSARGWVARVGGEEFVAFLPDCPLDRALLVAENVRLAFKAHEFGGIGPEWQFTASFGVTLLRQGDTITSATARADKHLYQAKWTGRDRVVAMDGHSMPGAPPERERPVLVAQSRLAG